MSAATLSVRMSASFRVATPAKAVRLTRWIEVFLGSALTVPKRPAVSTSLSYIARICGCFLAKRSSTV